MPLLPLVALSAAFLAGQEPIHAADTAGSDPMRAPQATSPIAKEAGSSRAARTPWYPTKETRPIVELPEDHAVEAKRTDRKPGPVMLGARLRDEGMILQVGFRDKDTTTRQWTIGIGGTWKKSEDSHDSLESSIAKFGLAGRIGREIWFAGPGNLTLVGSATAQVSGAWNDSTYDTLVQMERKTWSNPSDRYGLVRSPRTRSTGELSFGLLLGAGIRIHSSSGKAAFYAGVEAGPGWTSSEDEDSKISHSEAAFLEPSWQIGLDWCF